MPAPPSPEGPAGLALGGAPAHALGHATDQAAEHTTGREAEPPGELGMIWAQAHDRIIGADGDMPWHLPEDLRHFRRTTGHDPVIMGRSSWDALPPHFRPLPGRRNIVLSGRPGFEAPGAETATSLESALSLVEGERAWVCGGARVYAEAMPHADVLVVTDIDIEVAGDRRAPRIGAEFEIIERTPWLTSADGLRYRISSYRRTSRPADG